MVINKVAQWLTGKYVRSSNDRYIKFLRKRGVEIGNNVVFRPKSSRVDLTRPSLLSIGDNCYFNENFTILTHDWVTHVFIHAGMDFIPCSGKVTIGNNVGVGYNVMILKGVEIGDNVFIGANSLVTKDIPSNCIAAGVPCRVICTLDEYYMKRMTRMEQEAFDYARSIKERYGRKPVLEDFWEEFPLFIDGNRVNDYPGFSHVIKKQLGPSFEHFLLNHRAKYDGLESFLKAARIED